jgi:prophage regulatory protein
MKPSNRPDNLDYLLTAQDVADLLRIGKRSVWRWLREGKLPAPLRYARNCVRWRASDIQKFVARQQGAAPAHDNNSAAS